MTRLLDALAYVGDRMRRPFDPFLLWMIDTFHLEKPLLAIIEWLSDRLDPERRSGEPRE